jgi:hypothetical protein
MLALTAIDLTEMLTNRPGEPAISGFEQTYGLPKPTIVAESDRLLPLVIEFVPILREVDSHLI